MSSHSSGVIYLEYTLPPRCRAAIKMVVVTCVKLRTQCEPSLAPGRQSGCDTVPVQ
jgi:hypothetical protein